MKALPTYESLLKEKAIIGNGEETFAVVKKIFLNDRHNKKAFCINKRRACDLLASPHFYA